MESWKQSATSIIAWFRIAYRGDIPFFIDWDETAQEKARLDTQAVEFLKDLKSRRELRGLRYIQLYNAFANEIVQFRSSTDWQKAFRVLLLSGYQLSFSSIRIPSGAYGILHASLLRIYMKASHELENSIACRGFFKKSLDLLGRSEGFVTEIGLGLEPSQEPPRDRLRAYGLQDNSSKERRIGELMQKCTRLCIVNLTAIIVCGVSCQSCWITTTPASGERRTDRTHQTESAALGKCGSVR